MSNNKLIGIILLVAGAILVYFGLNATDAPLEELTESLTGRYSDKTMAYLVGGGIAAVLGLVILLKNK